ncbi:MAG: PspC domain-containing protein [Methanosarcinales archaeon]|nr:PspC domain-containing protein [Methanosarcinales archaeon]
MPKNERLVKSKTDHVIWGVCGGIAEYFKVDPVIVRLAFVVLVLIDGVGILLYIILAIIMPEAEQADLPQKDIIEKNIEGMTEQVKGAIESREDESPAKKKNENTTWLGVILILLGAYFLLNSFHLLNWVRSDLFLALLLILIGIGLLFKRAVR